MKWAALFSQTGSEICNLSEAIGRWPDKILTDTQHPALVDRRILTCESDFLSRRYRGLFPIQKLDYYLSELVGYDLITLHGWLNIVPAKVCEKFTIYNGHPGLINVYPDLKGKDPQQRAFDNIANYEQVGSVVHRVVPEVDAGEIVNVAVPTL